MIIWKRWRGCVGLRPLRAVNASQCFVSWPSVEFRENPLMKRPLPSYGRFYHRRRRCTSCANSSYRCVSCGPLAYSSSTQRGTTTRGHPMWVERFPPLARQSGDMQSSGSALKVRCGATILMLKLKSISLGGCPSTSPVRVEAWP